MPEKSQPRYEDAGTDPTQLKNLLLVLEHARADAWFRRDRQALEALLAPDFIEINYFGRLSRDDLLQRCFPHMVLHTYTIEDPVLHRFGSETAALIYQCYEELTVDGRKMKGTYSVSALYCWDGKRWKLTLWQVTPLKKT
ncbi:MAG: nuclear transport factor 2 family protein [Methanomicrobiales archaeon]|nr:nuclear transport factor 2 family protein [Methanomicrobiales archaeon]